MFDDNDGVSNRQLIDALITAQEPSMAGAGEVRDRWAKEHIRAGEEIRGQSCAVTTHVQPFHYQCTVTYRNHQGRYRGYELRLVQSVPGRILTIVQVRPRRAGPPHGTRG